MQITQRTHIQVDSSDIVDIRLQVSDWDALVGTEGYVRHNVANAEDRVKKGVKRAYEEHIKQFLVEIGDPEGKTPRALMAFGTRNSGQNLFLPLVHSGHRPKVLFRKDEPIGHTIYQAFCVWRTGAGLRVGVGRVRFAQSATGDWGVVLIDDPGAEGDLMFAIVGQPILFDGAVTPLYMLAGCTYDLRHIWAPLLWEERQGCRHDKELHEKLMGVMMGELLTKPVHERAAELARVAADGRLAVSDGYLHSSIGVSKDCRTIHLLMMNGSLEEIANAQKALGSFWALLLDNGGSVGAGFWNKRDWSRALQKGDQVPPRPTFVGNDTYFRPRGHAIVVMELKDDYLGGPFRPRLTGDAAWRVPPVVV